MEFENWNKQEKHKMNTGKAARRTRTVACVQTPLPLKKKKLLRGGWTQANELRNGHEDIRFFHIPIIHLSLPPKSVAKALGAIHSTKISGNSGPKLNGSVRSNRKSFEKNGPPFEVVLFSRSDRSEFWLNGSRPLFPISLGIDNPPERTWKQYLCKILGVNKVYNG